jgi:hypothetical protein
MDMQNPRSMIAPKVLSRVGTLQQGTRLPMLVQPLHILTSLSLVSGVQPAGYSTMGKTPATITELYSPT